MLPFISIIIPTFNRAQPLAITLDSFISQDYPTDRYEIIIANNRSTDNTPAVIEEYCAKFTNVRAMYEGRQGVHYARNSAAKMARGDILYFTDDDMLADRSLLLELIKVFDLDPSIGTATGLVLPKFDTEPPAWVRKYLTNVYLSVTDKNKQEELIISRSDFGVYSCHQAIKREVFIKSGGFNPENTAGIWIGDGETGLNIKIKQLGYKFAYTTRSIIYHAIPSSRTTLQYLIARIGNQGYCDSYTAYREHRQRMKIPVAVLKRNTLGLLWLISTTVVNMARKKVSWHFLPAHLLYIHRRNMYDLKLFSNESFRRLVEIDDWLQNDPPIKL